MSINPLSITQLIKQRYLNYLQTTFQINNPELDALFKETLLRHELIKGPIIEATPPFKKGCTIQQLIDEGILSPLFATLNQDKLPVHRPLYLHQENAIRKVISDKENIVVATGTGSGKTEIFIISVLNDLFRQQEAGKLNPGVRALILYPMNALVNDQLKRLRELLKDTPSITFGRYTGETLEDQGKTLKKYEKLYHQEPLPNELISREVMRGGPPHILLTNYAMLEYLLLRPDDNCFFDGESAKEWRFLILDEAHTYNGAKGIEMAMLLRRLKDRVVRSEPGRLRCIATSATLGKGRNDYPAVSTFASSLFGELFREDGIVGAEREEIITSISWGRPDEGLYKAGIEFLGREKKSQKINDISTIALNHGVPLGIVKKAQATSNGNVGSFLFSILEGDDRLVQLKKRLILQPDDLNNLYSTPDEKNTVVNLVELTGKVHKNQSDDSLLSARYHFFVRAVEGAYLQFFPDKHFYLKPTKSKEVDGYQFPVFEVGSCKYCGIPYLVGVVEKVDGKPILKQKPESFFDEELSIQYFLLSSSIVSENENEDDEIELGEKIDISGTDYILCGRCGSIDEATRVKPACSCGTEFQIKVKHIQTNKNQTLQKCPFCTKTSPGMPVVSRFYTGRDAVPSVLATAIYEELPQITLHEEKPLTKDQEGFDPVSVSNKNRKPGKNLLVFSDSRQDAAYFAPFLNNTHQKILRRALILQVFHDKADSIIKNHWRISDFVYPLKNIAEQYGLFGNYTEEEKDREIKRWLMHEFVYGRARGSLEELGLMSFRLVKPQGWIPPSPLKEKPWELSDEEIWTLFQILLDSFRVDGAIRFPEGISPTDDFFQPRNFQFYYRENSSSRKRHILSWTPQTKYSNKRLDYLVRIAEQLDGGISEDECRKILHGIWRFIGIGKNSSLSPYFTQENLKNEGVGILMNPKSWDVTSSLIDPTLQWYECDRCKILTSSHIRSVCPTYRCKGTLRPVDPSKLKVDNHYRVLYTEIEPTPMRVEEHTAQLTNDAASDLQQQFIEGKVNVLSCSTTFELGVDVGELEAVFMRNMPPTAANYIQRAGRAGRRIDAAAFVTTFCQRRSHDLSHFNDPMPYVRGVISPPFFELENEKIVKRHIFATAIAEFWRKYPDTFHNVGSFFFNPDLDVPEKFYAFLQEKPHDLQNALIRIVPEKMIDVVDVLNWGFIEDLFSESDHNPEKGLLTKAQSSVVEDIRELEKVKKELLERGGYVDQITRLISTIKKRPIIDFLSSHNIIPKYGFPIDVVELQVLYPSDSARKLELQRDLKIAISEYAPGSQVVAAGNIWESQYVKRNPKQNWLRYRYVICDVCHRYHSTLADTNKEITQCEACSADLQHCKNKGEFIIPEFGFVCSNSKPKTVGEKRPRKTYSTRPYFSGECIPEVTIEKTFHNGIILKAEAASHGKLAVINDAGRSGFRICKTCGYSIPGRNKLPNSHKNAFDRTCTGTFMRVALGHQYLTDILKIEFEGYSNPNEDFWFSLLYALLEGMSAAMGINRDDIEGCIYPMKEKHNEPALILFDTIPGGAGHVRRAIKDEDYLSMILQAAYNKMSKCTCGSEEGHSSCYGCLRNYTNQFCHERLDRSLVMKFLETLGVAEQSK